MSESNDDLMGIGEVARLVGLDPDTVRFYERRGILPAPARDVGGRRRYTPDQVETIRRLVVLKSTGMSLADIAEFASLSGTELDSARLEVLARREAELRAERRRLDAGLEILRHKLDHGGCHHGGWVRHLPRPDGDIAYSVTGSGPWLFLVGAPAGRSGFAALAKALSERFTVVVHDPRGIGRSSTPMATPATPQVLAEDLLALVSVLTDQPVQVFGTSGGAVTVLEALTQAPQRVAGALVHEPPLVKLLGNPDLEQRMAEVFYRAATDPQAAFEQWLDLTGAGQSTGPGRRPAPSGALPPLSPEELDKNRYFLGRMAGPSVFYQPDWDALAEHRPVVCAGDESHGQLARRTSEALANRLGVPLVDMPGNHLAASTHADLVARQITATLIP